MWAFFAKKQKDCDPTDPADDHKGDYWDHVALDPEHRLILAVVPGSRSIESTEEVVAAVKDRPGERPPRSLTSNEHPTYATAIATDFGTPAPPGPTPRPGRPPILPSRQAPEELVYATVHKEREKDRVISVRQRLVLGDQQRLDDASAGSGVSRTIDTSFVERHHGTERGRSARRARKMYKFSKDWRVHEAMTFLTKNS